MFFKKHSLNDIKRLEINELKKRIKVVVIDDEEDSFPIEKIQSFGFTLEYWEKIDVERLKRLENNEFDIIILDIYGIVDSSLGTKRSGVDILKSLKDKNPSQIVIAFSGSQYEIEKGNFWKLADECLNKPLELLDAKEILESVITKNYSIESLIAQLKEKIEQQTSSNDNNEKIESLIANSIIKSKELSLLKLVKYGITDTASIVTIVSAIRALTKD